ncbi:VWA domain-containing protein, partial [Patescibacteria group bacterium]|nr:VWA domain-containing protein [Patescibacteria group bacterium]
MRNKKIITLAIASLLSLFAVVQTSFAITTRDEMMSTAESYANYAWTPMENNVCHKVTKELGCCVEWNNKNECISSVDCRIDTPDRNTYTSWAESRGWEWEKANENYAENTGVPYNWGGFSALEDFEKGVDDNFCAGNSYTIGGKQAGSVGVDCSGFVSKAWTLKSKKSTSSLPNISKKLDNYDDLKEGDILNKRGHVMLHNRFLDSKIPHEDLRVYESVGYYWKVKTSDYNIANLRDVQKYKPYTSFPSDADIEIVVDASFSMSGEGREKAKEAVNYFVGAYKSNARIGIVGFSDSASVVYPLTMLENSQIRSDIKEVASDYLDSYLGGETHIAKGLKLAREKLNEDTASNSPKVIILISDGYESPENTSEPDFANIDDVLSQIAQDGIIVHTIRMGWQASFIPPEPQFVLVSQEDLSFQSSPMNLENGKFNFQLRSIIIVPDIDPSDFSAMQAMEFLRKIAEETGGGYQSIFSLESFMNVCTSSVYDFYQQERSLKKMYGEIFQGQIIFREFFVDPSMETATFSLFWPGSELDFTLIQPNGVEITPDLTGDDVSFSSSGIYKTYEINVPMNGLWKLKIYGKEVSYPQEEYAISIGGLSGIDLQVDFDKDEYALNNPIKISASVVDQILDVPEDQYVYGADVKAEIKDPEGNLYDINLADDDNDGIYTGEFLETAFLGQYDFTIEFNGNSNIETSDSFTREKTISTTVTENILKSARQLKQEALEKLRIMTTDNKQAWKEIDKAIRDIESSLDSEFWIDDSHLEQQHGHKVFDMEKQAIKSLLKIVEEKGKHKNPEIAVEIQDVIGGLAEADILLAETAIYDAKNITVEDFKFQEKIGKEINKAKEKLEKAFQELANGNPDKAIDNLKASWKSAQ